MSEDAVNPWAKPARRLWPSRREAIAICVAVLAAVLVALPMYLPELVWRPGAVLAPPLPDIANGAYLIEISGCASCHRSADGSLGGGRRIATPFGVVVASNITPDEARGIGGWSLGAFAMAVRKGLRPDGVHLYPAFPYTSYAGLADSDIADMKAHLDGLTRSERQASGTSLPFPFSLRPSIGLWKLLFFHPGSASPAPPASGIERGRYLAEAVAHCGECHTARNRLGARSGGDLAGSAASGIPNITPHASGIGGWPRAALIAYLATGIRPDGRPTGGDMALVIDDMTSRMTEADRLALADYLRQVRPLPAE